MSSNNSASLLVILPLLAAGFIFNSIFYYTRFRLSKADGQRLFFSCAISGLIIGGIGFLICHALRSYVSETSRLRAAMDWMHVSIPVPYGLTFIATIILAVASGHAGNLYLKLRKLIKAPKDGRRVSVWAFWRCMPEYITALDELLRQAVLNDSLVLLCLKSRKVYCGIVSEIKGNHESAIAHVQIIPAFSITRNKDTLQFEQGTKTEYKAYHLKRAFERLETLNSMIDDTGKLIEIVKRRFVSAGQRNNASEQSLLYQFDQTIKQLMKERKHVEENLRPYSDESGLDIGAWVKVIPVTEIESASLYKDEDYNKWFSDAKPTSIKPFRYESLAKRRSAKDAQAATV